MSGNKYDDILKNFDESEKWKLKLLLDFMGRYHPKIEIDRVFQRDLKSKLLKKSSRKWPSWYSTLSYLSVFATSFIVLFGIWKIWWIPSTLLEQGWTYSVKIPLAPPHFEENQYTRDTGNNPNMNPSDTRLQGRGETPQVTADSALSKMASNTEKALQSNDSNEVLQKSAIWDDSPNLSEEIQSISDEIDALVATENRDPPVPTVALVSPKMEVQSTTMQYQEEAIILPIDYPGKMVVYNKVTPWTNTEIETRTGSGATKKLEITLSKDQLKEQLRSIWALDNISLEYRKAKKKWDEKYYLIPSVRSMEWSTMHYTPLVTGYLLD